MARSELVTGSVARVVVGLVHPNLVGVDGRGGVAPLLHLDGAVPLLDPDLNRRPRTRARALFQHHLTDNLGTKIVGL